MKEVRISTLPSGCVPHAGNQKVEVNIGVISTGYYRTASGVDQIEVVGVVWRTSVLGLRPDRGRQQTCDKRITYPNIKGRFHLEDSLA